MNILNILKDQLSGQTINQLSNALGESPDATRSALNTALPALLGSAVGQASSPSGASQLFNVLNEAKPQGGWSDTATSLLGGLGAGGAQPTSNSFLSSLLGSKAGAVADFIAARCGLRTGSTMSLLGMASSFLMGNLGKFVSSQGLGASGFSEMLRAQTPHLQGLIPPQLANILGIGSLLSASRDTQRIEPPITPLWRQQPSSLNFPNESTVSPGSRLLRWAWVPLLLVLGVWLISNRARHTSNVGGTVDGSYVTVQKGRDARTRDTTTAGFDSLNLVPGSAADSLAKAMRSGDAANSVELQGVTFDDAGNLTGQARSTISELGAVLRAPPGHRITITAYGPTRDAALAHANALKSALTGTGVSSDHIGAKGEEGDRWPKIKVEK